MAPEPVEHVEFLVEELSMEFFLRGLLPRVLGDVSFDIYPAQGKQDLLASLPQRLQGYSRWLPSSWRLVVLVDRDDDDCHQLKRRLEDIAAGAGLVSRSAAAGRPYTLVNRLVVEELEAWYFGDWEAVRQLYPAVSRTLPTKAGYRDPDAIRGGTWEALERIMMQAGYFKGGVRKIELAKHLSPLIRPDQNRSRSFAVFLGALAEMVSIQPADRARVARP
jgi:Domain of unknown function (DUF4276)